VARLSLQGRKRDDDPAEVESLPRLKARIADAIHLHVLQSLALTQLQIELSRRMCEIGQEQQAVAELDVAAQQLQEAARALQQIMHELGIPSEVIMNDGRPPGFMTETGENA
jgi:hypothetical protein